MRCPKCGQDAEEGYSYCARCGTYLYTPEAPAHNPSMLQSMSNTYGVGHSESATVPAKPFISKHLYIIIALGIAALAGIALLVILVVAGTGWFGGGDETAPQKTVEKLLEAMEEKRADVYLSLWTMGYKDMLQQMMEGMDYAGSMEEFVGEMIFPYESIRFEGMEYRTSIEGSRATVEAVAGKLSIIGPEGEEFEMEITDPGDIYFKLVEYDGTWHVSKFWFFDMTL